MQTLTILNWAAWAPNLHSKEAWHAWSAKPIHPTGNDRIDPKTIPAILKRRASHLSKMAIEISNQALENHTVDYAVFCSQHGELNHTMALLKNIANQEILSPASFSQSVHNTSAGLLSVMHQLKHNMTSIAAGENSFLMGIVEVLAWLQLNSEKVVLFTMFDDNIPEEYGSLDIKSRDQYVLSMILTEKKSASPAISVTLETINHPQDNALPQALRFLAWFLQDSAKELRQQSIRWKKQ